MLNVVFNGTSGLNNVTDPARLFMSENGTPLISCLNVEVGDSGRVSRMAGSALVIPGNVHSLTTYEGKLIYVRDKRLYAVNPGELENEVYPVDINNPLYYFILNNGNENVLYIVSHDFKARLINTSLCSWERGQYFGPDTTRQFSTPPNGQLCEYAIGRMWIALENVLYSSEPANPLLFDYSSGRFSFESRITFVAGMDNGLWVGTKDNIFWINSDGLQFERKFVTSYGIPEGKPVRVDLSDIQLPINVTGTGVIALTNEGFAILLPGGHYYNVTSRNVTFKDFRTDWSKYSAIKNGQYIYTFADNGVGLTLNVKNFALTQHDCYPFNSMTSLNKALYGANENGIYKVIRSKIDAEFSFTVNTERTARIRFLHLFGEFSGELIVEITNDDTTTREYIATPRQLDMKQHEFKIPIRRDNGIGTSFKVRIRNLNGSDFALDRVEITSIQRRLYSAT